MIGFSEYDQFDGIGADSGRDGSQNHARPEALYPDCRCYRSAGHVGPIALDYV